jgi:membrane peptidoglycan carboxypeptidase
MLYSDEQLQAVSEPSSNLVMDGRYVNLLIVQTIRDEYEEALTFKGALRQIEEGTVIVITEQPESIAAKFLEQLNVEMLDGLRDALHRVSLLVERKLARKRMAATPKTGTTDYDDLGDDKRGEGE